MTTRHAKFWLGIGLAALAGTAAAGPALAPPWSAKDAARSGVSAAALLAQSPAPAGRPIVLAQNAPDAGEAGEAGEASEEGAAVSGERRLSDGRLFVDLMLIKGHLRVGRQLFALGAYERAAKHFWHPVEEIYPEIEAALKRRAIEGFEGELRYLARQTEEGEIAKAAALYDNVLGHIERVTARLDVGERRAPGFVIPALVRLMNAAAREYDEAVAGAAFGEIHEYQDGRGFIWVGRELLGGIAGVLYDRDPARLKAALAAYEALMAAWPAPLPPKTPVMTPSQVYAQVSRVELALSGSAATAFADQGVEAGEAGEAGEADEGAEHGDAD